MTVPGDFAFTRLTRADFPLLRGWLDQPPVRRWWCHETTPEALERDFGPTVDHQEPGEDLLALLDGEPVGLVQRSRVADYAENLAEFAAVVPVPPDAVTLDYLLGDPSQFGQGLGSAMIAAAVRQTWRDVPDAPAVVVSVCAANAASWRALERAGLRRVGEGDVEPENPLDPPLHYVYRVDRPA